MWEFEQRFAVPQEVEDDSNASNHIDSTLIIDYLVEKITMAASLIPLYASYNC